MKTRTYSGNIFVYDAENDQSLSIETDEIGTVVGQALSHQNLHFNSEEAEFIIPHHAYWGIAYGYSVDETERQDGVCNETNDVMLVTKDVSGNVGDELPDASAFISVVYDANGNAVTDYTAEVSGLPADTTTAGDWDVTITVTYGGETLTGTAKYHLTSLG